MGYVDSILQDQVTQVLNDILGMVKDTQEMLRAIKEPKKKTPGRPPKDAISPADFVRMNKAISETMNNVYKMLHGRAAQEEIVLKIRELQRHLARVESHNAERERRARSKPLIDVVGSLIAEEEILDDGDLPEIDAKATSGTSDADLRRAVEVDDV